MAAIYLFLICFVVLINNICGENTTASAEPANETVFLAGIPSDNIAEIYNFLDGESIGIGPLHEFVYGWQAISNTMAMINNVELRKRAGLQRFSLAGINGITLINHIGVTQIMINGTRSYCFGGVVQPPDTRSVYCRGSMYQENRFTCKKPYLRYPTIHGYYVCIDELAIVRSVDGTNKQTDCVHGEKIPKFHYDYICERMEMKVRRLNLSDINERFNIRNPIVRRVEFYRAPYDVLKQCPDWYGCNLPISPDLSHEDTNLFLLQANDTAFIGHGGKYWLTLYYSKLASWSVYFQAHAEYPWQTNRPTLSESSSMWEMLLKANIGPDMNLHYNLNGIYNRYGAAAGPPDLMRNDGQVQPSGYRQDLRESMDEFINIQNIRESPIINALTNNKNY